MPPCRATRAAQAAREAAQAAKTAAEAAADAKGRAQEPEETVAQSASNQYATGLE